MRPIFLETLDVIEIHQSRIELYGGSSGIRDVGLLHSAVSQAQAGFGGQYLHEDLYAMAAAYLYHIARNHPFVDGNKRTALAAALVFLDFNGIEVIVNPKQLEDLTIAAAQGKADKAQIAEFFKKNSRR